MLEVRVRSGRMYPLWICRAIERHPDKGYVLPACCRDRPGETASRAGERGETEIAAGTFACSWLRRYAFSLFQAISNSARPIRPASRRRRRMTMLLTLKLRANRAFRS